MSQSGERIALVGLGTIGISFAALYLLHTTHLVRVFDPRPDLVQHLESVLPAYLDPDKSGLYVDRLINEGRLKVCSSLEDACRNATIVQEQGPENISFKVDTWGKVISAVSPDTHLWTSTSGILASRITEHLEDKARLLVVHPFNPPHLIPLIEIVPSPMTKQGEIDFVKTFFQELRSGHQPVVVKKELPGFVGNRLAFVLLREACHLVAEGVVSVDDLDKIVECSIGPRWAAAGPFKTYNYGGGARGLGGFMGNLAETIEEVWDGAGALSLRNTAIWPQTSTTAARSDQGKGDWVQKIIEQTKEIYGLPTSSQLIERDSALKRIIQAKGSQMPGDSGP